MVLLELLESDSEGHYEGLTNEGERVKITGVPHPAAVAIYGERAIDSELERLRTLARADDSSYYYIQDSSLILNGRSNNPQSFAISYITFNLYNFY